MNKITIIGTGSVGSTIAYTLTATNIASEIVMIDVNDKKAMGEALDIRQGTPFCHPCSVYAGGYPEAENSDIVIITSGIARKPGQSRLELAQTNVNILKSITENIVKYAPNAIYVIVSNPVDVMTYAFAKFSGLPENQGGTAEFWLRPYWGWSFFYANRKPCNRKEISDERKIAENQRRSNCKN